MDADDVALTRAQLLANHWEDYADSYGVFPDYEPPPAGPEEQAFWAALCFALAAYLCFVVFGPELGMN